MNHHHHHHHDEEDVEGESHSQQAQAQQQERFSNAVAHLLMAVEELRCAIRTIHTDSDSSEPPTPPLETFHVVQWRHGLEGMLHVLQDLASWTQDSVGDVNHDLQVDLLQNCHDKVMDVAQQALQAIWTLYQEPPDTTDEEETNHDDLPIDAIRQDGQGAIARITEINLLLRHNRPQSQTSTSTQLQEIVSDYVTFQRQTLRQRSKPFIARLVQARKDGTLQQPTLTSTTTTNNSNSNNNNNNGPQIQIQVHDDDDDDAIDVPGANSLAKPVMDHYHAPVLAGILGQAAALIHPLQTWKLSLPPIDTPANDDTTSALTLERLLVQLCDDSIHTLDEQAQALVKTISDWFWEDRPIEEWMQKSANNENNNASLLYHDTSALSSPSQSQQLLGLLDGLVDEMAFACQVLARYQSLIHPSTTSTTTNNQVTTIETELLPEWTWKYATLERFLAMQQWQSALAMASPVTIVMGTLIQVPSVVEDAQYLSTRALERAAQTQSVQAIGTVAHAISHDVWSTEMTGGVHQALADKRGCWIDSNTTSGAATAAEATVDTTDRAPKSGGGGFTAALLGALDEDLGDGNDVTAIRHPPATAPAAIKVPNTPSSGNFFSNIVGGSGDSLQQMQLDTEFCVMNGINAAGAACRSLVEFLDTLLSPDEEISGLPQGSSQQDEKSKAMIQLAREELSRFAESYSHKLTEHVKESIAAHCGPLEEDALGIRSPRGLCFQHLKTFFEGEVYNLDANSILIAESDDRLDRELIIPLRESRLLGQMSQKCDSAVLEKIGKSSANTIVELILDALWKGDKQFTDLGSLLLSKQVRLIQNYISSTLSPDGSETVPPNLLPIWERLMQVLTVLQLEKPSDWLVYESILTPTELRSTLSLRTDFSKDAIEAVVGQVSKGKD